MDAELLELVLENEVEQLELAIMSVKEMLVKESPRALVETGTASETHTHGVEATPMTAIPTEVEPSIMPTTAMSIVTPPMVTPTDEVSTVATNTTALIGVGITTGLPTMAIITTATPYVLPGPTGRSEANSSSHSQFKEA